MKIPSGVIIKENKVTITLEFDPKTKFQESMSHAPICWSPSLPGIEVPGKLKIQSKDGMGIYLI